MKKMMRMAGAVGLAVLAAAVVGCGGAGGGEGGSSGSGGGTATGGYSSSSSGTATLEVDNTGAPGTAYVYLDGNYIGSVLNIRSWSISAGSHGLYAVNDEGMTWSTWFTVSSGQTVTVYLED